MKNHCALLYSFLTNRGQRVTLGNYTSLAIISSTGAPQGCCLGPTLFSKCTDGLRANSNVIDLVKYADDTLIIARLNRAKPEHLARYQSTIDHLSSWCADHNLLLNKSKTRELIIDFSRSKPSHTPVTVNSATVERVESFQYLGVTFQEALKWDDHFKQLIPKLRSRHYAIKKIRTFGITTRQHDFLVRTCIASIPFYCAIVFFPSSTRQQSRSCANFCDISVFQKPYATQSRVYSQTTRSCFKPLFQNQQIKIFSIQNRH